MSSRVGAASSRHRQPLATQGAEIVARMTGLARKHGAVDLVQGYPEIEGPKILASAVQEAVEGRFNQYSPTGGLPALKTVVARLAALDGADYDPEQEVLITTGCTAALCAAIRALIAPGDEVILFEPFWHLYLPLVRGAGGIPVIVPLVRQGPRFALEADLLRRAVSARTRMIIVNSPNNPVGTNMDRRELQLLADVAIQNDLIVVSDQVYEFLSFEDPEVSSIAKLPGMRERTVIVSSASKTLSITGWRLGWALAPRELMEPIHSAHILLSFCAPTPLQFALAKSLEWAIANDYIPSLRQVYLHKRELLCEALHGAGFDLIVPDGGFFIVANVPCASAEETIQYCVDLVETAGVAALPARWFFDSAERAGSAVRFSFCKRDAALKEAAQRLGTCRARAARRPAAERAVAPV